MSHKALHNWEKKHGRYFASYEEVETKVQKWQHSKDFHAVCFDALVSDGANISVLVEDMSRNTGYPRYLK
jgi:hypothetical protein